MGARDELIEVQTELESARGATVRPLLEAQTKLFAEHADELWGPIADLQQPRSHYPEWRRGYLDQLHLPYIPVDGDGYPQPLPHSRAVQLFAHPSTSALRRFVGPYWVRNLPDTVEDLELQQAVVTRRLMSLPRLRSLHIGTLVDSPPFSSRSLTHLSLRARPSSLVALREASLPSLAVLSIRDIDNRTEPHALLPVLQQLQHAALSLSIQGRIVNHHWTAADLAVLEPIHPSIVELELKDPLPGLDVTLPNVRRLSLKASNESGHANRTRWSLPRLPAVDGLTLRQFGVGAGVHGLFDQLEMYGPALQSLHLEGWDPQLLERFLASPMPRLEELTIAFINLRNPTDAVPAFAAPAFELVKTLSTGFVRVLEPLAASPLAPRLETLSLTLAGDKGVESWLAARPRFPRLKTLVVRGPFTPSLDLLARLHDQGHDVVVAGSSPWPDLDPAPGSFCLM